MAALPPTIVAVLFLWGLRDASTLLEVFDLERWQRWFDAVDRSFLFLLILPFVVAAVGLWAHFNERDSTNEVEPARHKDINT